MTANESSSPSLRRRQALRQADEGNGIVLSQTISLDRYNDISSRLLNKFQLALDDRKLDEAYVYGIRFLTLTVKDIPKHVQYKQFHSRKKKQLHQESDAVLKLVDQVSKRMDAEELLKQQNQKEVKEKEKEVAMKKQKQNDETTKKQKEVDLKKRALAKLSAMQSQMTMGAADEISTPSQIKAEDDLKDEYKNTTNQADYSTLSKKSLNVDTPENFVSANDDAVPTRKLKTPRRQKEEATILLLQKAIDSQLERLEEIEMNLIPALLKTAKKELIHAKKDIKHRKTALHCVAQKQQLQQHAESSKAAIFHMETQLLVLENAMEDRHITQALQDANQAMQVLEQSVGIANLSMSNTTDVIPTFIEAEEDNPELLQELEEWLSTSSTTSKSTIKSTVKQDANDDDDDVSILSLPQVPSRSTSHITNSKMKNKKNRGLLRAIF
jgi:hypothetical protein